MQFPIYLFPYLGNGMAIGLDAVFHVIMSHGFAIGAFSLLVFAEYWGWRKNLPAWEEFAHSFLNFLVVVITAVGAITGVGIWFFISVLEPRGTGSLLRIFFWAWFVEWIFFTGEVVILLLYYFTWDRWVGALKRRHIWLGVVHVIFAIVSMFLITGVLSFMLTSDGWPFGGSFWQAFFNPTMFPQLVTRLGIAYVLGSIITSVYLLFTNTSHEFRREALHKFGAVLLTGLVVGLGGGLWYFSVVPGPFKVNAPFAVLTSNLSQYPYLFWVINGVVAVLIVSLGILAWLKMPRFSKLVVIPTLIVSIFAFVEFERTREFVRGPYIMPGYMYANQVLMKETSFYQQNGLIPNSYWYNATVTQPTTQTEAIISQGAYLFGQNCSVCHSIGGMNDIATRVRGRSQDGILVLLSHTHEMVPFMVPISASPDEQQILAQFLYLLSTGQVPIQNIPTRFMDFK